MSANTSLRVTELDFDSIKNNLKTFLRSQSQFQDFDFEGSGMNVLLDLLAYNTHYNAYYLNMIANEMFLDTSRIRESTVSHAKLINYVPESPHGAETRVNILVTPSEIEDPDVSTLTLNKYTRFIGTALDGINYSFVAMNSNTVAKVGETFNFANVTIKQGEVITRQFLMSPTNTKRKFEIQSANVDINTISVTVQESTSNTDTHAYNLAEDITEITSQSKVYFVEENEDGRYRIYFGDDVIGKKPKDGNIIIVTYLDTEGSVANKINVFTIAQSVGPFSDNVRVSSTGASYSGSEKETIEQIKYRAPYYYTAQNRAVTVHDYETLLVKDYPNIDSVSIWGGEDNIPPVYGKVFISLKTKENFFLSNLEKEKIKDTLIQNRSVLTVFPEIIDPEYKYILVRGKVYYDSNLTTRDSDEIRSFAIAAIEDYNNDNLNRFKSVFRKSKMVNYIEQSESSITSTDISVLIQKRILLELNKTKNYTIDFGIPIKKGDFKYFFSTYPAVAVLDSNLIQRKVFFEEVPSIASGIEKIEIENGGINYSSAPIITITGDGTGATAEAKVVGGKIYEITITNKGTNYTRAFVSLSAENGSGAIVKPILESRVSKIRSYYVQENGEKVFVSNDVGKIEYDSGIITLNSLSPLEVVKNEFYDSEILAISVPVDTEIINSVRNDIVIVDVDDPLAVQIEAIAE